MQKTKIVVTLIGVVTIFFAGYQFAANRYERDIAEARAEYATKAQTLEEKYREKEREQYNSLVLALEERDKALASLRDRSADLERLRKQAADARSRLSASGTTTCSAEREQLARCAGLLERGYGLLERGAELSERTAIDKDAVVKIVIK